MLTSGLLARVPRIAPLTIVSGVTAPIFAVVVIVVVTLANRNDRVIVAIVEILRGGRLVIVRIAVGDAREVIGFCWVADPRVPRQCAAPVGGELSSGSNCGWIDLRSWTVIALVKWYEPAIAPGT